MSHHSTLWHFLFNCPDHRFACASRRDGDVALATELAVSPRTVRRWRQALADGGWLHEERHGERIEWVVHLAHGDRPLRVAPGMGPAENRQGTDSPVQSPRDLTVAGAGLNPSPFPTLVSAGQMVDRAGHRGADAGEVMDRTGQNVDNVGQSSAQPFHTMDKAGHKGGDTGEVMDRTGQNGDNAGQRLAQPFHTVDDVGHRLDSMGQTLAAGVGGTIGGEGPRRNEKIIYTLTPRKTLPSGGGLGEGHATNGAGESLFTAPHPPENREATLPPGGNGRRQRRVRRRDKGSTDPLTAPRQVRPPVGVADSPPPDAVEALLQAAGIYPRAAATIAARFRQEQFDADDAAYALKVIQRDVGDNLRLLAYRLMNAPLPRLTARHKEALAVFWAGVE